MLKNRGEGCVFCLFLGERGGFAIFAIFASSSGWGLATNFHEPKFPVSENLQISQNSTIIIVIKGITTTSLRTSLLHHCTRVARVIKGVTIMNNHFQSMSHEFAHYLTKASAIEFLGIARLLHVRLVDETNNEPINAD